MYIKKVDVELIKFIDFATFEATFCLFFGSLPVLKIVQMQKINWQSLEKVNFFVWIVISYDSIFLLIRNDTNKAKPIDSPFSNQFYSFLRQIQQIHETDITGHFIDLLTT